jgi:uncharacterized protein (TIGR00255 family)
MIQSMTGYGECERKNIYCEIKSLNQRFFNTSLALPEELTSYAYQIEKLLKDKLTRGFVYLKIIYKEEQLPVVNKQAVIQQYKNLKNLKQLLNLPGEITLDLLCSSVNIYKPKVKVRSDNYTWNIVKGVINSAVDNLIQMRKREGGEIKEYATRSLNSMDSLINLIKKQSPKRIEREKKRFKELLSSYSGVYKGVEREICIFADKVNIQEELSRFGIHLDNFRKILKGDSPCGKRLGFLLQELLREANTIASKAQDARISMAVVDIKNELENLREQTENVL